MTEHEKYQEHIRHTHDVFCKTVIRHAAIDAARSIRSRRKRELSLEYLIVGVCETPQTASIRHFLLPN